MRPAPLSRAGLDKPPNIAKDGFYTNWSSGRRWRQQKQFTDLLHVNRPEANVRRWSPTFRKNTRSVCDRLEFKKGLLMGLAKEAWGGQLTGRRAWIRQLGGGFRNDWPMLKGKLNDQHRQTSAFRVSPCACGEDDCFVMRGGNE